ncbi:MAG: RNA polymerase sigma factor [Acidobacteriota bacterium]
MSDQEGGEAVLIERRRRSSSPDERQALLTQILEPHLDRIGRWAVRLRGNPDEAADLAQEALAAVCHQIDSFRGESRFSTWLYTVVRNQAYKQWEKRRRRRRLENQFVPRRSLRPSEPEEEIVQSLRAAECRRLLAEVLTPVEARVFLLHFADGVPLAVVARQLGLTNRSGARAYLVSAKRKLQRTLRRRPRPASEMKRAKGIGHE